MATLYQAVLGAEFDALAPALRRFHGQAQGGRARGHLRVIRGRGPLARLVGWCIGAPTAGEAVPVEIAIEIRKDREHWVRSFAGCSLLTRQWQEGPRLAEALGPSVCLFELERDGHGLVYVQRGCRLLGVPLPGRLSPRIRARIDGSHHEDAWHVDVDIAVPLLGTIVGYSGIMAVEPSA